MAEKPLPFGEPVYYEGQYKEDKIYPLYIQMITLDGFEIKKNKIPTIQLKNNRFYKENDYLESFNKAGGDEPLCLVLTSVDLQLFLEHYEVYGLDYVSGWKFKATDILFKKYIDKWIKVKNEATISGNKGQRTMAKLMLNSLYGKLATSLDVQSKIPYMGEDKIIHYSLSEKEQKDGIYIPAGSFITAYAREKTIRTSQAIKEYSIKKYGKDMYIYSDTDSIKTLLPIEELTKFCEIDDIKLGAWKNEGIATKGKWIRQKCYLEEFYNYKKYNGKSIKLLKNLHKNCKNKRNIKGYNKFKEISITCAGLPKQCYDYVTWENFKTGFTCGGKLTFKHVKRWRYSSRNRFYD